MISAQMNCRSTNAVLLSSLNWYLSIQMFFKIIPLTGSEQDMVYYLVKIYGAQHLTAHLSRGTWFPVTQCIGFARETSVPKMEYYSATLLIKPLWSASTLLASQESCLYSQSTRPEGGPAALISEVYSALPCVGNTHRKHACGLWPWIWQLSAFQLASLPGNSHPKRF